MKSNFDSSTDFLDIYQVTHQLIFVYFVLHHHLPATIRAAAWHLALAWKGGIKLSAV